VSNILKINRIIIDGIWQFDHSFHSGINAIVVPNGHGKTTLLNIIQDALSLSNSSKRKDEPKLKGQKVLIEIELNNKVSTIKMITENNRTNYFILSSTIDKVVDKDFKKKTKDEITSILEEELGLVPYNYRNPKEKKNPLNNLGQAYRGFILIQDHQDEIIADYSAADVRRNVIQSWLRQSRESNEFEDKSVQYTTDIKNKEKELDSFNLFVKRNLNQLGCIIKELGIVEPQDLNLIFQTSNLMTDIYQ